MRKNIKKDNILKRRKLVLEMSKLGLNRISKNSLDCIDEYVISELKNIFKLLKEELDVNGKKTLEKRDVEKVLKELNQEDEFEI